jgi:hypothetical protein
VSLSPGTRLGPYEVTAQIGAGGMGEVWCATDTNLGRQVAIKILPDAFAQDPDRLARFEREAKTLASLNHPNIAIIHGLEKTDGIRALVMELVEGPTLADRIAQGPIPIDEALPIAKQIAEALEAAHEQGIIHRDLKPANVKVREDGTVKVLDFGLAKFHGGEEGQPDVTQSPTITTPAMTQAGVILGTAAYMSPEQAKGRKADTRSDIWAFGCVLYEMLTGRRAFDGEDMTDVLGAVVHLEPDFAILPSDVPLPIRTLIQSCLVKDRRHRVAGVSTALFVLDKIASLTAVGEGPAESGHYGRGLQWRRLVLAGLAGAVVAAAAAGGGVWVATRPDPSRQARFVLSSPSAPVAVGDFEVDLAISPDATRVAYISGPQRQIYVRALDRLEPTPLEGTDNASGLFFSPDGNWIGFSQFVDGRDYLLRKVPVLGGTPVTLATLASGGFGASWGSDNGIVFGGRTLVRVPGSGGDPVPLMPPSDAAVLRGFPEVLPGGRAVLFTAGVTTSVGALSVSVLDLETHEERVLIRGGGNPRYSPTGHIVYGAVDGTLRAVPFDLDRLEVTGDPVSVLEGVITNQNGVTNFSLAADGSLAYIAGRAGLDVQRTIVKVDRQGQETPLAGIEPGTYRDVRVSPDGKRVAVANADDVFTYDVARATLTRLTTHAAQDGRPLWTPDGERIVFTSGRSSFPELFWKRADGSGEDERILTRGKNLIDLFADGWSRDGNQMLFTEVPESIRCAIGQIPRTGAAEATMLVRSEFCSGYAAVSPDGRWFAYNSLLSGRRDEIYVERYPERGNRQQISTNGGTLPIWSKDGRELFFSSLDGRQILVAPVRFGTTLVAGRPDVLFEGTYSTTNYGHRPYDLFPDGRFVMIKLGAAPSDSSAPNLVIVQNWTEELKRRVPTN